MEVVDGLRGLAVCLVVLFHVWQISWLDYTALLHSPVDLSFMPGMGFVGVDLFFFLSAFCLTLPYARHWLEGGPAPTLGHHFGRRAAKILPSYWVALVLLLLFHADTSIPPDRLWFHIGTHLLFIHNLFFESLNSIGGVLWSLATEVQFYFLLPLLLLVFRRHPIAVVCVMLIAALTWRAASFARYHHDHDEMLLIWRDAQLPARLDTFAAGMATAYLLIWLRGKAWVARVAPLFALLAVVSFAALLAGMRHGYVISRWQISLTDAYMQGRLPMSVILALLTLGWCLAPRPFGKVIANPILLFLSAVSYNLYLWHQMVARFLMARHLPRSHAADPHTDLRWQIAYTLMSWVASIAVAGLLTVLVETPFLRGLPPWLSRGRVPTRDSPSPNVG